VYSIADPGGKMSGGYVEKTLKKTNRRLITIGVIVLIITALVILFSLPYYLPFFNGPTAMTGQDLADDVSDNYLDNPYIHIEFNDFYYSDIYDTSFDENGNEVITTRYYVATVGEYQVIIGSEFQIYENSFTGEAYALYDWAAEEFASKISEIEPNSGKTFLPILITDDNFRNRGFYGLALAALFLFLSLTFIITGARHKVKPETHPSMKELAKLGPTDFMIGRLDSEMESPHERIGKNHLLAGHLLIETRSGFSAVSYNDIVWAFKQNIDSKNFGVHFGTISALMIMDRAGRELFAPCKAGELDRFFSLLLPRIPYAYKGFTNELASVWREDPKILTRGVDERKVSVAAPEGMPPLPSVKAAEDTETGEPGQDQL
jgi:hypothetical protein